VSTKPLRFHDVYIDTGGVLTPQDREERIARAIEFIAAAVDLTVERWVIASDDGDTLTVRVFGRAEYFLRT